MNAEARIQEVFESVLDDGTPWRHPNAPITIVATKGRCVHARLSGTPEWSRLFEDLLSYGGPCTEFRLEGRDLFARLKTPEQIAADGAAMDYDEAHGELATYAYPDFEAPAAKPKKREKDKRGPIERALEEYIRESGETTFVRRSLLEAVRGQLKADGREVRIDSLGRTFDTKIVGRVLNEIEGTDGEEFSLIESEEK